ncbi:16707_t:CDS:2 [Funneliformis caledonium]|uniref:16707_t:CDS:1 n=1 Tax=Funneliformis caledonium TaxID=1117310 RepID=A0A9N8YZI1_9GLOM|nr:16707_t:CDS:2 [Funneliformis caledonium]
MKTEVCEANKSNELNKRLEINGHENAKSKELKVINDSIKRLKNSNIEQLETQLEYLSKKVTDLANATKPAEMKDITVQEVLMMKSLYWLVKELAKETEEKADLASISNYLETDLLRADDLENIFEIDVDISERNCRLITELRTYLSDKSEILDFPSDTTDKQDKLNYYFTLDPEYVITALVTYNVKHNANNIKKEELLTEMKEKKDGDKPLDIFPTL